jgi:V-type H+-transporting ATPase subunit G
MSYQQSLTQLQKAEE